MKTSKLRLALISNCMLFIFILIKEIFSFSLTTTCTNANNIYDSILYQCSSCSTNKIPNSNCKLNF